MIGFLSEAQKCVSLCLTSYLNEDNKFFKCIFLYEVFIVIKLNQLITFFIFVFKKFKIIRSTLNDYKLIYCKNYYKLSILSKNKFLILNIFLSSNSKYIQKLLNFRFYNFFLLVDIDLY